MALFVFLLTLLFVSSIISNILRGMHMRKCKIIISDLANINTLILDEEKNVCLYNNIQRDENVELLLCQIEDVISEQPNEENKYLIVDGVEIEIYFIDNERKIQYKLNLNNAPKACSKICKIMEGING